MSFLRTDFQTTYGAGTADFGIGVISMGSILPGTCASGPLPSGTLSSVLVVQVVPRPTPASQGAS